MPAPAKRLAPGQVVAYATVLRLKFDAPEYETRAYEVRLECCGKTVERTQRQLMDMQRRHRTCCAACAAPKRLIGREHTPRGVPIWVGEVIGPVTVIAAGASKTTKLIRWACCGKEELVGHERLHKLRSDAKSGQTHHQCWACRFGTKPRPGPRPQLPPPDEILPPGILSAAIAWPRPRVGA
jgi:hypothetical protein